MPTLEETEAPPSSNGARQKMPASFTRQVGETGTPQFGNFIIPDDYVADLADPGTRMQTFEEMRASDDAVHTALAARESLLQQANWQLNRPKSLAPDVGDFIEDNLYPVLPTLLAQLGGGANHYGFGLLEPVFEWRDEPRNKSIVRGNVTRTTGDYGRKIFLRRLVHIRQRTVTGFRLKDGELAGIKQAVFTAEGFRQPEIPAEKAILLVYDQQGDDFYGRPPTRHAFKAWTFKNQIERLNILGLDRFGVGVPVAVGGQGWQPADFAILQTHLKNWRSGANTYLVTPFGGTIDIKGGDGPLIMALLEWARHYALAISLTYLTQSNQLAINTSTGARSLGETMYEQAEGVSQADCEATANAINERLIVPLVDWNFGPQKEYPTFNPSQRVRASSAIANVIKTLIDGGAIHWNPETDEPWLREALKLPEIDLDTLVALVEEEKVAAEAAAAALAAGGAPGAPGSGDKPAATEPKKEPAAKPQGAEAEKRPKLRVLTMTVPKPAALGTSHRTAEFTDWESKVVKPALVLVDLESQSSRAAAEVREALAAADASLVQTVESIARDGGAVALSESAERIRVPGGIRRRVRRALLLAAERARLAGANAVVSEFARQDGEEGTRSDEASMFRAKVRDFRDAISARWAARSLDAIYERNIFALEARDPDPDSDEDDRVRTLLLLAAVAAALVAEINRREQAARGAVMAALASGASLPAADLAARAGAATRDALENLSLARTEENVRSVVNVGFGEGRRDGADRIMTSQPDAFVSRFYSAVLDGATCDECAQWDGAEFPLTIPDDPGQIRAPNPRCAGSIARCRCIWIYRSATESPTLVGPTRSSV